MCDPCYWLSFGMLPLPEKVEHEEIHKDIY